MRHAWVIVLLVVLAVFACGPAYAADRITLSLTKNPTASPWTSQSGYGNQAIGKLGFGVKNLLLGWLDLFKEPAEAGSADCLKGVGYGIKDTIENELGGAVHTVTFFLPQVDAPLPEGGVQL